MRRPKLSVLLVEDDADQAALLHDALLATGLVRDCRRAADGQEAVHVLETRRPLPSLVLLDLRLPALSGFEVLRWRRDRPEVRVVPVVVLTASADEADLSRAYALGANSYLLKPASARDIGALAASVTAFWGTHNRRPDLP